LLPIFLAKGNEPQTDKNFLERGFYEKSERAEKIGSSDRVCFYETTQGI
jgi:hypothetical protein